MVFMLLNVMLELLPDRAVNRQIGVTSPARGPATARTVETAPLSGF